jgi:hypothetical protein
MDHTGVLASVNARPGIYAAPYPNDRVDEPGRHPLLAAASREAVISRNGTSAIVGPVPIGKTRNVSIAPAAVIDV